eukprot:sb/3477318/
MSSDTDSKTKAEILAEIERLDAEIIECDKEIAAIDSQPQFDISGFAMGFVGGGFNNFFDGANAVGVVGGGGVGGVAQAQADYDKKNRLAERKKQKERKRRELEERLKNM